MSQYESIFGNIKCRNKIYCLEASANTLSILAAVKTHIIGVLEAQAKHGDSGKFNIVCFNTDVAKWCVSLVPCTNEHVVVAEEWLRHIQPRGTCNLLGAIVSALREPSLNCICALVTQEPDESLDEILDLYAYIGRKIPVHIRLCLINDDVEEIQVACDIYMQIAEDTNGSFAIIKVNEENKLVNIKSVLNKNMDGKITIYFIENSDDSVTTFTSEVKRTTMLQILPGVYTDEATGEIYPMCNYDSNHHNYQPFDVWKRVVSSQSYIECMKNLRQKNVSNMKSDYFSSLAASIIVGRKVLARKYSDGLYYLGTVKEQIDTDLFKVVLGPYNIMGNDYMATDYLKTKLLDLIDIDDAWKRSIMPGDRVLAPDPEIVCKDSKPYRYVTGTVLDGFVCRGYTPSKTVDNSAINEGSIELKSENSKTLIIEFTHPVNKTEKVICDNVIYIPEPFFQRLCLEGAMPKAARERLYNVVNYPQNSMPGYPTSGSKKDPKDFTFTHLNVLKGKNIQVDFLMPPYCLPIYPIIDILEKEDRHKNLISKNVWNTGSLLKSGDGYNNEDTKIPESIYTVNELKMKVSDQLNKFKHVTSNKYSNDKNYFKKSYLNASSNENMISKTTSKNIAPVEESLSAHTLAKPRIMHNVDEEKNGKVTFHTVSQNFSIHDKYFDEVEKIRTDFEKNSEVENLVSESDKSLHAKVTFNETFESILRPGTFSKGTSLLDIGEADKVLDENNNNKLRQRRRQVEKRLEVEKERFCYDERKNDFKEEYRRAMTNQRITKEKQRQQNENNLINTVQLNKRKVAIDIDSKVEHIPSCTIKPATFDEIDRKRIEYLRQKREVRESSEKIRNECALKYIEKLEENKKNRCDGRWWDAQKNMLKEYSEKT